MFQSRRNLVSEHLVKWKGRWIVISESSCSSDKAWRFFPLVKNQTSFPRALFSSQLPLKRAWASMDIEWAKTTCLPSPPPPRSSIRKLTRRRITIRFEKKVRTINANHVQTRVPTSHVNRWQQLVPLPKRIPPQCLMSARLAAKLLERERLWRSARIIRVRSWWEGCNFFFFSFFFA